jgi:hypothetical protein
MNNPTRNDQENHFRYLFENFHGTPMAVSSESLQHKELRYTQLAKLFSHEQNIQIHDVGMGLGSLYTFIKTRFPEKEITYSGSEILLEYVEECQKLFPESAFYHRDISESFDNEKYDYVVMSGVFHQKRNTKISDWERFSQNLIKNSFMMAKKGIGFNFITPFVDFYQAEVYYCNLPKLLNFINDELSRFFVLHHNYALFEFTMFVYQEEYIAMQYPESEFNKYFKR